jgi:hypothetical protein
MDCYICTLPIEVGETHTSRGRDAHCDCVTRTRCFSCRWHNKNCGICKQCVDWDKWQACDLPNSGMDVEV